MHEDVIDSDNETWVWGTNEYGEEGYFYPGPEYIGACAHTAEEIQRIYGLQEPQFVLVHTDRDTGTISRAEGPMTEALAFKRRNYLLDNHEASSVQIIQHVRKSHE